MLKIRLPLFSASLPATTTTILYPDLHRYCVACQQVSYLARAISSYSIELNGNKLENDSHSPCLHANMQFVNIQPYSSIPRRLAKVALRSSLSEKKRRLVSEARMLDGPNGCIQRHHVSVRCCCRRFNCMSITVIFIAFACNCPPVSSCAIWWCPG